LKANEKGGVWVERQAEAKKQADAAAAAILGEAVALDKLRATADKAGAALKKVKDEQKAAEEKSGKLASGLRALGGGALADVGDKASKLKGGFADMRVALGSAGVYAAVAVALVAVSVAVLAIAAAAAAGVAKLAEWAVGLADARRSAVLLASGGFAQSSKTGQELYDTVTRLTKRFPQTREELTATAKSLAYYGLKGEALTKALEQSSVWAARIKFGPDWEKQMLALPEQSKILEQNIAGLFGGLKIDPLLKGIQKLVALFDETTASGKAIKVVFESVFQPLVDGAAGTAVKIEAFFLQMEIWSLKALIALKPHTSLIVGIGEAFLVVSGIIVGVVVVALGLVAAALAAPLAILAGSLFLFQTFTAKIREIGPAMIDGLVNGIKDGAGAVWEALKGVVMNAVNGVKSLLGIHSPSKVFADIGAQTGAGMEIGVERSSGGVQNAMETMAAPPTVGTAKGSGAAAANGAGSTKGANISGNTFVLNGVQGAEDAEARIGALLTRLIEGDATQLGAAVSA
jgi:hypothetical protein